jgi:hypothetical protein
MKKRQLTAERIRWNSLKREAVKDCKDNPIDSTVQRQKHVYALFAERLLLVSSADKRKFVGEVCEQFEKLEVRRLIRIYAKYLKQSQNSISSGASGFSG